MTFSVKVSQITNKVTECVNRANSLYGITLPFISVQFDLRGRCAGTAERRFNKYAVRFNVDMMADDRFEHLLNNTVPHEVAHIVCMFNPRFGRQHDNGWKRVCIALGGNGERLHSEEVTYAKGNTYVYTLGSGSTVNISETRHRRIQNGSRWYTYKHERIDKSCSFALLGSSPIVASPPIARPAMPAAIPATKPVVPAISGMTKSEQVRQRIAQAKRENEDPSIVVQWAVNTLGMTRSLASVYVKNNWSKA